MNEEENTYTHTWNCKTARGWWLERMVSKKSPTVSNSECWTLRYCSHHRMVRDISTCSKCLLMKVHLICAVQSIIHRKWWLTSFQCKYLFCFWALTKQTSCNDLVKCGGIRPMQNGNLNLQFHSLNTKSVVLIYDFLYAEETKISFTSIDLILLRVLPFEVSFLFQQTGVVTNSQHLMNVKNRMMRCKSCYVVGVPKEIKCSHQICREPF